MNNCYSKILKKYYLNAWYKVYHRKKNYCKEGAWIDNGKRFFSPIFSGRDLGQRCTQGWYTKGLAQSLTMYQ